MQLMLNMTEIKGKETLPPMKHGDIISDDVIFTVREYDGSLTLHTGHFHCNNCFYAYSGSKSGLAAKGPPFGTDSALPVGNHIPLAESWAFVKDIKEKEE